MVVAIFSAACIGGKNPKSILVGILKEGTRITPANPSTTMLIRIARMLSFFAKAKLGAMM